MKLVLLWVIVIIQTYRAHWWARRAEQWAVECEKAWGRELVEAQHKAREAETSDAS